MRRLLQTRLNRRQAAALAASLSLTTLTPLGRARPAAAAANLTLVAYSTPREAYDALIPLFQQTPAGKDVQFQTSYGASGDQSRAVAAGLPADVVAFSLAPDITRLVDAKLVADDWANDPFKGMVTDSVVVLGVRPGNPKGIEGWDDLVKAGVEVITPNPLTSGGARWNIMAAWGAQIKAGKTEEEATAWLGELFKHVPVQDKSARESLQTFIGGEGDIIISYENEAITAKANGEKLDWIVPGATILIENPIAVTTESQAPEQAKAFVDFLRSAPAQAVFAEKGYRPVLKAVTATPTAGAFPTPAHLFTIDDLGGWPAVTKKFFDPDNGIVAKVQQR
ncbi:MAG TPA: sulfate ABC transporter substrate-binding protein [Thermomicrobiales bacterium]|nr:sulfate ABC transporter substrate-binding protein [Thermomicrobiales bacterium]